MRKYTLTIVGLLMTLALVAQSGKYGKAPANVVAVDLGLPSGTKWASLNVGAEKPEDYGEQYAWGETEVKEEYTEENYLYGGHNIGSNICGTEYDVAHVKWGGKWQMPTKTQIEELIDKCTYEEVVINGISGVNFIGPNGNSVFFPTKNIGWGESLWSGTPSDDENGANVLHVYRNGGTTYNLSRWHGYYVRPVEVSNMISPTITVIPEDIHFGVVKLGTDKTKELTVTNTSDKTVTVTMDGCTESRSNFDVSDNQQPVTLAAGESKVYTVTARGTKAGCAPTQSLLVNCDGLDEPIEVQMSSYGDDDDPIIDLTEISLSIGEIATVKVRNSGYYSSIPEDDGIVELQYCGGPGVHGGPIDRHHPFDNYSESEMTVKALKVGVTHITFTDMNTNHTSVLTITVNALPPAPRTFIDLGLPSSTKWANMNVGASRPEEYGKYFSWGETIEKNSYTWDNYICSELTCGKPGDPVFDLVGNQADIAGSKLDAATMNWGAAWNMPTATQIEELVSNCSSSLVTINGVQCRKLKSRINGNEIIFPLAGARWDEDFAYEGTLGYYWSSTLRQGGYVSPGRLILRNDGAGWGWSMGGENDRYCAFPIRPVYVENNNPGDTLTLNKFSVAFNDNDASEMIGTTMTFQRNGTAESYSLSSDGRKEYDQSFDISKVSYITRKSIGKISLPEESTLSEDDLTITIDGDTISADDKGIYDATGSTLIATNNEGEVIYMNIAAVEDANNVAGADLNAKESAITLMLPLVPNIFVAFDDEYLPQLKEMIWDVDEVKQLAAAIDRSVAKYGYTDFGEISSEATAARNKISQLLHLDKLAVKQAESAAFSKSKSMIEASNPLIPPYITNPYGYGGLQVEITDKEEKQFYRPYNISGYNCEVTAYNYNRFAYSSIVKGKYDAETNTYYIPDLGNDYDYYKNILKPQKVSTFMNTFTSFKEEDLERLGQFLEESIVLVYGFVHGEVLFDEMHWSDEKITVNFDISEQDDAVVLLYPRGSDYMMVYNIMQSIMKPIVKLISKKAAKAFDSDIFVPFVCGKLLNDPNYILEVKSAMFDSELNTFERIEKIKEVTWTRFFKVINNEAWDGLNDGCKDAIKTIIGESVLKAGSIEAAYDWVNIKAAFKVLGWVKKYGDILTGVLGTFFEDNAVYPIYWDANGQFVLEKEEVTVGEGESTKVRIIVGNKSYSVVSSDEDVATVRGAYNNIEIHGVSAGDAVITVVDLNTHPNKTAKIKVHVTGIQTFVLAESEVSVPAYKDCSVTIVRGDGPFHILGGDKKIAVAKLGGGNPMIFPGEKYAVVISGVSEGSTTFNIFNEPTGQIIPLTVNVTSEEVVVTDDRIVDLGLSVKWANCNVGADSPEEYGDFFAWGEVEPKDYYSLNNYKYYSNGNFVDIGGDISGTEYDAATYNMGSNWRMPTEAEYEELINKCEWKFVTYRRERGWKVTGPSGKSIFLPAAGYLLNDWNDYESIGGFYWSSNITDNHREVSTLSASMRDYKMSNSHMNCFEGRTIRAVTGSKGYEGLLLSPFSLTLAPGKQGVVDVIYGSGSYAVESSDNNVVKVTREGSIVTIVAVNEGNAVVTVSDQQTNEVAEIQVRVRMRFIPEGAVDLGLPSGVLWASCNLGASSPEERGGYFAWGETEEKDIYNLDNYKFYDSSIESCQSLKGISGTEYDVAHIRLGGYWRMPTLREAEELADLCNQEILTVNGVKGKEITGLNGNSIFFPFVGIKRNSYISDENRGGYYLVGTEDESSDGNIGVFVYKPEYTGGCYSSGGRYSGFSIRPVYDDRFLSLSQTYIKIVPGSKRTVKITSGSGTYQIINSRPDYCNAIIVEQIDEAWTNGNGGKYDSDFIIQLSAIQYGISYLRIVDLERNEETILTVIITEDASPAEAIDLGLPSGTKWAACNVGATKPEEYGNLYAWGEIEPKKTYTDENYVYQDESGYIDLGECISGTEYDVAHVLWGKSWQMPTVDEMNELNSLCSKEWAIYNGVNGIKYTGPNGNCIFLPAAGEFDQLVGWWSGQGEDLYYWTGTRRTDYINWIYTFMAGNFTTVNSQHRYKGQSVRPVQSSVSSGGSSLGGSSNNSGGMIDE